MSVNMNEDPNSNTHSPRFEACDADITFKSYDNVLFSVHKKNLASHTGGFAPAEFDTKGETIELEEDSDVLELLFQFIYPQEYPSLFGCSFQLVETLAEAAEKYAVFAAMAVCRQHMLYLVKSSPQKADNIVSYASKHSYLEIIDEAAHLLIDDDLRDSIKLFSVSMKASWALYRQQWYDLLLKAIIGLGSHGISCRCGRGPGFVSEFTIDSLLDFQDVGQQFNQSPCLAIWKQEIESGIQAIRRFSEFCNV